MHRWVTAVTVRREYLMTFTVLITNMSLALICCDVKRWMQVKDVITNLGRKRGAGGMLGVGVGVLDLLFGPFHGIRRKTAGWVDHDHLTTLTRPLESLTRDPTFSGFLVLAVYRGVCDAAKRRHQSTRLSHSRFYLHSFVSLFKWDRLNRK